MKIQLKRSDDTLNGEPIPPTKDAMEYGELAVNYNAADPTIFIKNSSDEIVQIASASANNKGQLWSDAGGNLYPTTLTNSVGIGTTNASAPLTIKNDSAATIHLIKGSGANNTSFLSFDGGSLDLNAASTAAINLGVGSTVGVHIDSAGKVGIKKTSPTAELDVAGSGKFSGKVTSSSTLDTDGDTTLVTKGYVNSLANSVVTGNATWTQIAATEDSAARLYPKLITTRVGIATQNPAEVLDVNGNVKVSGGIYYTEGLASTDDGTFLTDKAYVDANDFWAGTTGKIYPKVLTDKVGINTNDPKYALHVDGDVAAANYRIDLLQNLP